MKTLAKRIREARKSVGLLQQDLAAAAGLSQGQISRIESGKSYPNSEDLRKIAIACNTTVAQLCGEVVCEAPVCYGAGSSAIRITGEVEAGEKGNVKINKATKHGAVVLFAQTERGLVMKGDSMSPVVEDGQTVIYDTAARPRDGDLCVVRIKRGKNRGTYFRRYQELDSKNVVLVSVARHAKPMVVKKADAEFWLVTGAKYTRLKHTD